MTACPSGSMSVVGSASHRGSGSCSGDRGPCRDGILAGELRARAIEPGPMAYSGSSWG